MIKGFIELNRGDLVRYHPIWEDFPDLEFEVVSVGKRSNKSTPSHTIYKGCKIMSDSTYRTIDISLKKTKEYGHHMLIKKASSRGIGEKNYPDNVKDKSVIPKPGDVYFSRNKYEYKIEGVIRWVDNPTNWLIAISNDDMEKDEVRVVKYSMQDKEHSRDYALSYYKELLEQKEDEIANLKKENDNFKITISHLKSKLRDEIKSKRDLADDIAASVTSSIKPHLSEIKHASEKRRGPSYSFGRGSSLKDDEDWDDGDLDADVTWLDD